MVIKVLEILGLRALHLFTCRVTGEDALPSIADAPTCDRFSAEEVAEMRAGTRYFGRANFWRMVFHLPILLMLLKFNGGWVTGIFAALIALHTALLAMEAYKAAVLQHIKGVEGRPKSTEVVKSEVWGEWYFAPKKWETETFYRITGGFWFKILVEFVIDRLRLTKEEREAGKTVEYVGSGMAEVVRFENGSRVSECVHLTMAAIDLLPIWFAASHKLWLAIPYTVFVLWGDFGCAVLQRLNRWRIWTLIKRARKLEARQQPDG
ncbi:MAG: hypothetical protein JNM28_10735 [Armatimonadetes bacterium]|nr:hypothetical protein [Armatimonadota bacterium]MBS1710460.1 hypothetical protein [Armatimonadota bacterium]MBX3108131.1 hypothetical protein [Fimbriimonadaceae bacterium]